MSRKPVRIDTFGGFSVTIAGRALPLGRKAPLRPLALLQYLAAHAGRELPDDQVARALWPGRDAARGALPVTLHRLRRLLGVPGAIVHRQGRIAIDTRHVWCDAAAFDAMLDRSARCTRAGRRRAIAARALALYRGDFLAGEPRAPWVGLIRARLRARYVAASAAQGVGAASNL
jgi:LuxR family transcriptional regulator, maltose regulon positive regulatory protein